jgi:preprotein translocase subunit YajC
MNPSIMLLFYGAIFAVIYFFFIRPQSQKVKEGKKFIDEIQKGDKVVTVNGIHGVIDGIEDTTFVLRIDSHVRIRIEKSGISSELSKLAQTAEKK